MAADDLINFDIIEGQKENIQALPSGRSAKKLAELYSPSPSHKLSTPTPADSRNVHDCIRAKYEAEIQTLNESDDPLDVFDRYVRWTFDAYPSAQATPASQLHTLLERATKQFISTQQYKNDPRYLKLWLHYIHFFSDAPRETYIFLSRHAIGETLALFYEEYAEWLEGAGKWAQAEEVYKLGIEREARPVQRLLRKFKEFEQRKHEKGVTEDGEPSSPALPTVRPALAAKVNPFGSAAAAAAGPHDPQVSRPGSGGVGASAKPAKAKMAIFSDTSDKPPVLSSREAGSKGWETIGSMKDRKKENTVEAKPWVGETLKAGGKKPADGKMSVFRDPFLAQINKVVVEPSKNQVTVHPQTGKRERIYVDLEAVYPTPDEPGTELSFEEIMATQRGWLDMRWDVDEIEQGLVPEPTLEPLREIEEISRGIGEKLVIHQDRIMYDENGRVVMPAQTVAKVHKKKKVMEINETQIIKAKLDSPSGPKMKKKNASEPTMTLHTKAATDDIYDIFNAPLKPVGQEEEEEETDDEDNYTDGDYTTDAESTGTTRQADAEYQQPNQGDGNGDDDDVKSVASEWSDFSPNQIPDINANDIQDLANLINTKVPEEEEEQDEADDGTTQSQTDTTFVPIPPEDWEPRTMPFRNAEEVANNRLPFMTPITERTEVSLEIEPSNTERFKTPSKPGTITELDEPELEPLSSPLREIVNEEKPAKKTPLGIKPASALAKKGPSAKVIPQKGPIIKDGQCNPVEEEVRTEILSKIHPPLNSYSGFYDHRHEHYMRGGDIRRFAKALSKTQRVSTDRTSPLPASVAVEFPDSTCSYSVKRELGAGAFAPVYLVQNSNPSDEAGENDENAVIMGKGAFAVHHRSEYEALKMENPPTPWEFHMMRLAHTRLGPHQRATTSLSYAHELHLYRDEAFLFLPYHPHGTLLDVVNFFRSEPSGTIDEQLCMFFTIELLRTVEALHAKQIMHGDLKPDNCLLRVDDGETGTAHSELSYQWRADGSGGWSSRGVVLIDFGRGIDMRNFTPDVQFIADWKTTSQDPAEMREGRPWTWQIDYHGLAGTVHCLLFGKYIETMRVDQGGIGSAGRRYRIRESLKRYWQTELWADLFDVLLNPAARAISDREEGGRMPCLKGMRAVRERMEAWLQGQGDRGVGVKGLMGRVEAWARKRQHHQ